MVTRVPYSCHTGKIARRAVNSCDGGPNIMNITYLGEIRDPETFCRSISAILVMFHSLFYEIKVLIWLFEYEITL